MLEKSNLLNTVTSTYFTFIFMIFCFKKRYYISGIYVKIIIIFPDRVYYIYMYVGTKPL